MHVNENPLHVTQSLQMFFHTGACWVRGGLPVGGVPQEDQEPGRSPLPLPPQGRVQACFQGLSFIYFVTAFHIRIGSGFNQVSGSVSGNAKQE